MGLFYIFSIFPIIIIFSYLLFPFKFFIFKLRFGLVKQVIKSFFPFGKTGVRFKEYIATDILTSVAYPLVSLMVAFCMISCEECRKSDSRIKCKRENIPALFIQILPYFARTLQCLNKLYYSNKTFFYSFYGIKFIMKITFICISYLTKIGKRFFIKF